MCNDDDGDTTVGEMEEKASQGDANANNKHHRRPPIPNIELVAAGNANGVTLVIMNLRKIIRIDQR
jgi:hypothetical protein